MDDFYGDNGGHYFGEAGYFPLIFFSKTEVALLLLVEQTPALRSQL